MAFGAAACRFNGKRRETNPRSLVEYLQKKAPEVEELTPSIRREELVFMSLRTAKGLSLQEFRERTGEDFFHIYKEGWAHCLKRHWIQQKGDRIVPDTSGDAVREPGF